jgi:hypothetical protein
LGKTYGIKLKNTYEGDMIVPKEHMEKYMVKN